MTIEGIPPFTKEVEFTFDEHVNVFIGPNGSGKSTILRLLESGFGDVPGFHFTLSDDWTEQADRIRQTRPFQDRGRRNPRRTSGRSASNPENANDIPWVYIPGTRHNLPISNDAEAMRNLQVSSWDRRANVEVGPLNGDVSRILNDSRYLFDGNTIRQACKAITDLFRMGEDTDDEFMRKLSVKSIAYECAQNICSDILVEGAEPHDYVHHQPLRFIEASVTNVYDDMATDTYDTGGRNLFAGDLSAGTQGTLLWIWHLAFKMAEFYRYMPDWHTAPAILFIDEIEHHLHPTWQRRVIPHLVKTFEGLQVFAASHSPFIVAGRSAGQVHRLKREGQVIRGDTFDEQNIIGWTADEILRTIMGVNDPTDGPTAQAAKELRDLHAEGRHDDLVAEAERQNRIQELSALVDRDILAGGPMAAQRELFEHQFAEALEKYRRSPELNQDNG
jgi:energy-coupling factor transporter ATP-binding protein EcfA2